MPQLSKRYKNDRNPVIAYRPKELDAFTQKFRDAYNIWCHDMEDSGGDRGSCVIGAGLAVHVLPPRHRYARTQIVVWSPGQSDGSWCRERAQKYLEGAGLEGVHYCCGRMD